MPAVINLITFPAADSLNAAYRPIVVRASARTSDNTDPPVVYCDVYVNDVYYKTQSKTAIYGRVNDDPAEAAIYEFDIQDAIKEVLTYNLPAIDGSEVETPTNTFRNVFVRIRNANFDDDGFIVSEQTEPQQATSTTPAVDGGGTESDPFYVVNATLLHNENQDLSAFLDDWKTGVWASDAKPMTKRPRVVKLCKNDSSFFPIITTTEPATLCVEYTNFDGSTGIACVSIVPPPPPLACPALVGLSYDITPDFDAGTQTINFTASGLDPDPSADVNLFKIYYRPHGNPTFTLYTAVSYFGGDIYNSMTLPLGKYDFLLMMLGPTCVEPDAPTVEVDNIGYYPACPLITDLDYSAEDNGDGTQNFTFTGNVALPHPSGGVLNILYRTSPSGGWFSYTEGLGATEDFTTSLNLPLGLYDFQLYVTGSDCTEVDPDPQFEAIGIPEAPEGAKYIAYRSNPGQNSNSGICDLPMSSQPCQIALASPLTINDGDVVYLSDGATLFNGNNKWYLLSIAIDSAPQTIAQVDTSGVIFNKSGTCPTG